MSEYQYYEFLAIDKPLLQEERAALRAISTRARISSNGFVNEYHWSDLKANPEELLAKYFDAHVYVANWCVAIFQIRLPDSRPLKKALAPFKSLDSVSVVKKHSSLLLSWQLEESGDYERFNSLEGAGWMSRLMGVREEIMRGDYRALYIGWLADLDCGLLGDAQLEPFPLVGLGDWTASQQALAEFLEVDPDLLTGVLPATSASDNAATENSLVANWVDTISPEDARNHLAQILLGQPSQVERNLHSGFREWRASQSSEFEPALRSVGELKALAAEVSEQRLARENRERLAREKKERKLRLARLATLTRNFPAAWERADAFAAEGKASAYETACSLLTDLAEAYHSHGSDSEFRELLARYLARHTRRGALIRRIKAAGLG